MVVDDDDDARAMLEDFIRRSGRQSVPARSGVEALELAHVNDDIALVITDVNMPGMDGIELCQRLSDVLPDAPVIVLTGHGSMETVVRALRAGAYDFHVRPIELDILAHSVDRALEHARLRGEVKRLRDEAVRARPVREFIGSSPVTRRMLDMVTRVSSTDATVLIEGESGTGKELIAHAIHDMGARHEGPFVAINCAAVPPQLLESELFGHVRGAFTDARVARTGLFLEAKGGTLFLDEIGEMPLEMQSKLLRALQERTVRPVGGNREAPFDARVIAATNRDLEDDVRTTRFREDLYYRIAVVGIEVPSLRARIQDVPVLAQHFVKRFAERFGKKVVGIAPPALQRLMTYPWPGNVRELENSIERAVVLTRFDHLTVDDLPERVRATSSLPDPVLTTADGTEELLTLAELERRYIHRMMVLVGGNKSRAARILGLDRRTLYRIFDRERASSERGSRD
ncbi:MAG: sigma-54 dependent transcriptional regulator [Polyangiales bacterium]